MVTLKSHGKTVINIDEASIRKILDIYPDENLVNRPVFAQALTSGELAFTDLHKECDTLMIAWQLFMLDAAKVDDVVKKIDEKRKAKFDNKLIANRDRNGGGVSLRIADRLIALQEFANMIVTDDNYFCGSLKSLHRDKWVGSIMEHFGFDANQLASGKKEKTLDHIIQCVEAKNIRVGRGVLGSSSKLLPVENNIRSTYRKSSGFAVKDDKVPYIFLPNELGDNETPGRQILTLLVLLILIGNDQYDLYLSGDLELRMNGQRKLQQAFGVASEILLPPDVTASYNGTKITETIRDELARKYMLTPSAVVITLRQRGLITSDADQQSLLDSIVGAPVGEKTSHARSPRIDTAIRKMCGNSTTNDIINAITSKVLKPVEAQYLMFGRVDKLRYVRFKATVGL